jgi:hypothetical protein
MHGRLPIIFKNPFIKHKKVWFLTGFGSRGLIHHSLIADFLVKSIINNNDEKFIPIELRQKI